MIGRAWDIDESRHLPGVSHRLGYPGRRRRPGARYLVAQPRRDVLVKIVCAAAGDERHGDRAEQALRCFRHPVEASRDVRLAASVGADDALVHNQSPLRHYAAQRLVDNGKASLSDVQKLLGHQRTTTTDNYLKSLSPDLARLGEALEDDFSQIEGESMPKRYAQEDQK